MTTLAIEYWPGTKDTKTQIKVTENGFSLEIYDQQGQIQGTQIITLKETLTTMATWIKNGADLPEVSKESIRIPPPPRPK